MHHKASEDVASPASQMTPAPLPLLTPSCCQPDIPFVLKDNKLFSTLAHVIPAPPGFTPTYF